jgi:hypothetical protein
MNLWLTWAKIGSHWNSYENSTHSFIFCMFVLTNHIILFQIKTHLMFYKLIFLNIDINNNMKDLLKNYIHHSIHDKGKLQHSPFIVCLCYICVVMWMQIPFYFVVKVSLGIGPSDKRSRYMCLLYIYNTVIKRSWSTHG